MNYKNIYNYQDFLNEKNNILNEGLLGKAFKFLKNKLGDYSKKIKAAKEIDPIIEDAKKKIESYYADSHLIDELKKNKDKAGIKDAQGGNTQQGQGQGQQEQNNQTTQDNQNQTNQNQTNQNQTNQNQTNQNQTYQNESKIFESDEQEEAKKAEQDKKNEAEANVNPIKKAIRNTLNIIKKKIEPLIKDREGKDIYAAKAYANAKLIEIEEMIIQKDIELYKKENWDISELENEAKEKAEETKKAVRKLEETTKNVDNDPAQEDKPAVGDIYTYTNKKGAKVRVEVVNNDNENKLEVVRISSDDPNKKVTEQTPIDEIKDAFRVSFKDLKTISKDAKEEIKKTFSDAMKEVGDKFKEVRDQFKKK